MNIPFSKFSGAGNDFILIDNREQNISSDGISFTDENGSTHQLALPTLINRLCRRGLSVGADGVILIENSKTADFKMRYFNADGSEADTCGNGARCAARFAFLKQIAPRRMRVETRAGLYEAEITDQNLVKVKMSDPGQPKLNIMLTVKSGQLRTHFIHTGVPHVVVFISDILEMLKRPTTLDDLDVVNLGRELRYHPEFQPAGTNVNFVKCENKQTLRIRTYERGVENETLACGTGSIASTIIAYRLGRVSSPVTVHTRSGSLLKVYFEATPDTITNVYLEGDARFVYDGIIYADAVK
ncbi:MAG: diaminopimelate epimerase [bacterium]|nr:diaminopimelate epimerase [bacterium]